MTGDGPGSQTERDLRTRQGALSQTGAVFADEYGGFKQWEASAANMASQMLGADASLNREVELRQPEDAPMDFGAGGMSLGGWSVGSGHTGDGAEATRWGASGTNAPGASLGLMAGLGFPSTDRFGDSLQVQSGTPCSSILSTVDSRVLEARHIRPFESSASNKRHAWLSFKREVETLASIYDFGGGLFRDPPICVNPLNEPELLRLGVCPEDIKRARFAHILLMNTVKDGVGRHILLKSRSPSVAWRALDEHFCPKTSGAKLDLLEEFNSLKYSSGQDIDEYWVQLEIVQSQARSLGVKIADEVVMAKFLYSVPPDVTTVPDYFRMQPTLISGEKKDVVAEFDNLRYSGGQDTDEYWVQLEIVQSRARSLGVEIADEIVVTKFLTSLPPEFTAVRDRLRMEPTLLSKRVRAVVKDKYSSLKNAGGSKGTNHNRALSAGNKSSAPNGRGEGAESKSQKPATGASNSKALNDGVTTGNSSTSGAQGACAGKKNVVCFECRKPGHVKSQCPNRICEICGGKGHGRRLHGKSREAETRKSTSAVDRGTEVWIASSAEPFHMTPSKDCMYDYEACTDVSVTLSNGQEVPVSGFGRLTVSTGCSEGGHTFSITNIAHVPVIDVNFFSLQSVVVDRRLPVTLTREGTAVALPSGTEVVFRKAGRLDVLSVTRQKR